MPIRKDPGYRPADGLAIERKLRPLAQRWRRLFLPAIAFGLFVVMAVTIFGLRMSARPEGLGLSNLFQHSRVSTTVPVSHQIERDWGIRFTGVKLLADHGMVELSYEIVDGQKADRIHAGKGAELLPVIQAESTGRLISSQDLLFNVHRGMQNAPEGRQFSIIYGNANGWLIAGNLATIRMHDGLALQHVPIVS